MKGGIRMVKLNISSIKDFLKTVNECNGPINLLSGDGKKEDLTAHVSKQHEMLQLYQKEKGFLRLTLEIPDPKDYMKLVLCSLST